MAVIMQSDTGSDTHKVSIKEIDTLIEKKASELTSDEIERIMKSDPINVNAIQSSLNKISDSLDGIQRNVADNNQTINSLLAKTNSERLFYGNPGASHWNSLLSIETDLGRIYSTITDLANAPSLASKYNEKLEKLKNGAKIQMLAHVADEINACAESFSNKYEYKSTTISSNKEISTDKLTEIDTYGKHLGAQYAKLNNIQTEKVNAGTENEKDQTIYNGTLYDVAYYHYWSLSAWQKGNGPSGGFWALLDDDVEEMEENLRILASRFPNIKMPY